MNKKPGQPDSAVEITAGRKTLMAVLANAVADKSAQALAANWLRDLYDHHRIPQRLLESYDLYRKLGRGEVPDKDGQEVTLTWIHDLLDGKLSRSEREAQASIMSPNEQREQLGLPPVPPDFSPANETQVGGDHYNKRPIQHWDFVASHDYGYLEGQVTKYVFRWRDKNGLQDLQKASHFLQKLSEVADSEVAPIDLSVFLDLNGLEGDERSLFLAMHAYNGTLDPIFLMEARRLMDRLLAVAATPPAPSA